MTALLPVVYVVGYFALCDVVFTCPGEQKIRMYRAEWLARAYTPLSRTESRFTARPVLVGYDDAEAACVIDQ